jgi:hypothetical protein
MSASTRSIHVGAKHSGISTEFAEEGLAIFTQLQIISGPVASA